ncbi:uncharacterized protein CTRU02_200955 [Colletotrichum truncatum]|uniref:Uncharacterized protein n=1 Tax=Colletotrichum truncatum TaxID=5467 RepID=A0ACC3ZG56_COLTU|nr:uncharacterized protein CTRU02_00723 [Colletotrichum truncatum]KAF6801974.1 hypothetical protein CTRU02_00723 [Colletotrichum truncatum]
MSTIAQPGTPGHTRNGGELSTIAEQRTEPGTPPASTRSGTQSPTNTGAPKDTAEHNHQCRACRASFCQPLNCGHVYCEECLPPSSRQEGCPECKRQSAPSPPRTARPPPGPKPATDVEAQQTKPHKVPRGKLFWALFVLGAVYGCARLAWLVYITYLLERQLPEWSWSPSLRRE